MNGDSQATFANCLFLNNVSPGNGGGIRLQLSTGGHADIVNCTFSQNAAGSGSGIHFEGNGGTASVSNSVLGENVGGQMVQSGGGLSVTYSDIQEIWAGTGNIADDPLFVDPDGADDNPDTWQDNDYRLAFGSPCIDAGDNSAVPKGITTDLDGNPRLVDDPDTTDTGNGGPPTVDMGAYEYCLADLNHDGTVDAADLAIVLGNWGSPDADLNGDGTTNAADLAMLLGNWGPCA